MIKRSTAKAFKKRGIQFVSRDEFAQNFLDEYGCGFKPLWKNDAIFTCIDYIAKQMASLSIRQFDYSENNKTSIYDGLTRVLNDNVNEKQTRYEFMYNLVFNLYVDGCAYAMPTFKRRNTYEDNFSGTIELINNVTLVNDKYYQNGFHIKDEDILAFNKKYRDYSAIDMIKEIVVNLALTDQTKKMFYEGGYMPNLMVAVDSDSEMLDKTIDLTGGDDSDVPVYEKSAIAKMVDVFFKPKKGSPIVIPADKFIVEQIKPMSMKDIALNESIEIDKKRIANIFGVPLFVVGIGTYNEAEQRHFVNTELRTLSIMIEKEYTRKLLISPKRAFSFSLNSLLRGNIQERTTLYETMGKFGAITGNEIREQEGYDWIDGLDKPILIGGGVPEDATNIGKGGDENE